MQQHINHPSVITARPQPATAETTPAEKTSHGMDMLLGIGAIFLAWAVVAMWLLLFISCVVGTRGFLNIWL